MVRIARAYRLLLLFLSLQTVLPVQAYIGVAPVAFLSSVKPSYEHIADGIINRLKGVATFFSFKDLSTPVLPRVEPVDALQELVAFSGSEYISTLACAAAVCAAIWLVVGSASAESAPEQEAVANEVPVPEEIADRDCRVCFEEKPVAEFVMTHCGHNRTCRACLSNGIDVAIQDRDLTRLICPEQQCNREFFDEDINAIANPAQRDAIERIKLQIWLQSQGAVQCPGLDCLEMFLPSENGIAVHVRCHGCNLLYCSSCLFYHDEDIPCHEAQEVRRQAELTPEERESEAWLLQNTKNCPGCARAIQKGGGCNHITCNRCRHEFCWICNRSYVETDEISVVNGRAMWRSSCRCPIFDASYYDPA